jgi:hypothetical protein
VVREYTQVVKWWERSKYVLLYLPANHFVTEPWLYLDFFTQIAVIGHFFVEFNSGSK